MYLSLFCISYIVTPNEPCTLHSLILRLVSYLSYSQSLATFTISSAYTASTACPSLHYPHNKTPQECVNHPYRDITHISALPHDLHWLRVSERMKSLAWLLLIVFRCRTATASECPASDLLWTADDVSRTRCSASTDKLVVRRTRRNDTELSR